MKADLTREVSYRGFVANNESADISFTAGGGEASGVAGCILDMLDLSDVDVIQWMEKRAQGDGMDAGEPFKGARRIRLSGTLMEKTRGALHDALNDLSAAFDPILAAREEPQDKGYRPLYFVVPTDDRDHWPAGIIELFVKAMPRALQVMANRDQDGGVDTDALSQPFQVSMICIDPAIYGVEVVDVSLTNATPVTTGVTGVAATNLITKTGHGLVAGDRITFYSLTGGTGLSTGVTYYIISTGLTANDFKVSTTSGGTEVDFTTALTAASYVKSVTDASTWTNKGNYLASFNAVIEVGAGAGTIVATVGDSAFTITVPSSTGNRIIRIKPDKVITFEENNVEVTEEGAISFSGDTTWPLIDPGDTPYSITVHGCAGSQSGSHMFFYPTFA